MKGKNLDLGLLDKNHIAIALETADAAFVKTRTFQQSSAARTTIKVVEPMRTSTTLALLGLALLAGPRQARALVPAPDLPPGTFHEFRITSLTALTVAQQITQPSICTNGNTCLHNEVRVGVSIDFAAGRIAIDARAPEDENGNPVPSGGPGGILFNTQSGPVELHFAPPCENPDGCVGGQALYVGTIDQGGNIAFPSLGLDFELFGVSPISRFRGPMGTGSTTDPADPGIVATGGPLDFATGALHLAGVDFIPAPIVGTTLQLDRIRGTLFPVPIPPVEIGDLLTCQTAISRSRRRRSSRRSSRRCRSASTSCSPARSRRRPAASRRPIASRRRTSSATRMFARAIRSEQSLSRQHRRGLRQPSARRTWSRSRAGSA